MQSSPKRSESARTTTRPAPCSATAASGAPGRDAVGEGAGDDVAAVVEGERAGAVEAGLVHAGEEVDAVRALGRGVGGAVGPVAVGEAVGEVREHPRGARCGCARSPGRWRSRPRCRSGRGGRSGCCRTCPARSRARTIEPAAAADELVDGVELGVAEGRAAGVGGRLPLGVGGVGDDEDVGAREGLAGERAVGVGDDLEVAVGQLCRRRSRRRSPRGGRAASRSASSRRMVHASEWDSSKRTRATFGLRERLHTAPFSAAIGITYTVGPHSEVVNPRFIADLAQ